MDQLRPGTLAANSEQSYFLASSTRRENGFSQQYILITEIPFTISFIKRILLSVLLAVSTLRRPNCLPTQAEIR